MYAPLGRKKRRFLEMTAPIRCMIDAGKIKTGKCLLIVHAKIRQRGGFYLLEKVLWSKRACKIDHLVWGAASIR
jgi:hypothetical protein